MPTAIYWLAALLGMAVVGLLVANAIGIRRLRKEIAETRSADAAIEAQVLRFLASRTEPEDSQPPPRRLRLVPVFAGLAAVGALAKSHPVHAAGAGVAMTAAGVAVLVAVAPAPNYSALPDPPAVVTPTETRTPSLTSSLPSPGPVQPSTRPPGGGTPPTTDGLLDPPLVTTTAVSVPPSTSVTTPVTTTVPAPSLPVPTTTQGCLLDLALGKLAQVCVPALGR